MQNKTLRNMAKKHSTPLYLYDGDLIRARAKELKEAFEIDLFYACKANTNVDIIKLIYKEGFGIETVSPGEINAAIKAGVPISKITYTCGNIDEEEFIYVAGKGIRVHLDSLRQVEMFGKNFPGRKISVRLNLNFGAGEHKHTTTGGKDSKFGIHINKIGELKKIAKKYNLKINGLHQHVGSNILDVNTFMKGADALFETALKFPDLEHLDFGGGLGVPYRPGDKKLDLKKLGRVFAKKSDKFAKKYGKVLKMSIEPGRFLVAEAGDLLMRVNDVKNNPSKTFVGINSGINHLIRPAMYGSYHEIINLDNRNGKKEKVDVVGNICESGDFFAKDRMMPKTRVGDLLAVKNVGAYGYVMSSDYNSRPKPKEFLILNGKSRLI